MTANEAALLVLGVIWALSVPWRAWRWCLRWCAQHWGRLACFVLFALWVLTAVQMFGTTSYDPVQRDEVVDDFWGWMCLVTSDFMAIVPLIVWNRPKKPTTPKPPPLPPGQLSLPATYFMPYSVCPRCHTEALHWLTPRSTLLVPRRQCRSCEFCWEQRIGLPLTQHKARVHNPPTHADTLEYTLPTRGIAWL